MPAKSPIVLIAYSFGQNNTGKQGVVFSAALPKLSDVLSGVNPFYIGQSFTIQETVVIRSVINDYSLLRREDRWFDAKEYIGTWQRLNALGQVVSGANDYGLIRNQRHEMSHYSQWTVSADPSNLLQLSDGGRIRQCNLFLEPSIYLPGGTTTPVTGFAPLPIENLLIYENYSQPAVLIDRPYDLWWAGLGLYFYDGISGFDVELKASAVNVAYNGAQRWEAPTCGLAKPTCDEEFRTYILSVNNGQPIDTVYPGSDIKGHYSTQGTCDGDPGAPCVVGLFTCSDGGTRPYYYRLAN